MMTNELERPSHRSCRRQSPLWTQPVCSMEAARNLLKLSDLSTCIPNRRWRIADAVVNGDAPRRLFRTVIDDDLKTAIRYVRSLQTNAGRPPRGRRELDAARTLWIDAGSMRTVELQARILAGQTDQEVASHLAISTEAIRWYVSLFYDVREWLKTPIKLIPAAIGEQVFAGITPSDTATIIKFVGYRFGPTVLESVLHLYCVGLSIPERLDSVSDAELGHLYALVEAKALVEVLTMSPTTSLLAAARTLDGRQPTQWQQLADEVEEYRQTRRTVDTSASAWTTLTKESREWLFTTCPPSSIRSVGTDAPATRAG